MSRGRMAAMIWAGIGAGIAVMMSAPAMAAQVIGSSPVTACRMRVSVLQSYAPLGRSVAAAERVTAQGAASGSVDTALTAFDRDLAAALTDVPADQAAAFALTDVERVVEAIERCADTIGLPRARIGRAGAALDTAYLRNAGAMRSPDFAERLLRSPRAQAVLVQGGGTDTLNAARTIKAGLDEERRQARLAAAERERVARAAAEEDRRVALAQAERERWIAAEPIRRSEQAWRANASAPAPGATPCGDARIIGYAGRPKDQQWLDLMDGEVARCTRISDLRDGAYFLGLALGTAVTDEQLAHAAGRVFLCLSNDAARKLTDGVAAVTGTMMQAMGFGDTGFRPKPVWTERSDGRRRIVQVRCEMSMTLFGIDMQAMQAMMGTMLRADAHPFVEYEMIDGRLTVIRLHEILSNTASTSRSTDPDGTTVTRYICDDDLGQADNVARGYVGAGWQRLARVPWRYTMQNGALAAMVAGPASEQVGRWYTLRRGQVMLDLYNTRYRAAVTGKTFGDCNGGAVDVFAMLAPVRSGRVRVGSPVRW